MKRSRLPLQILTFVVMPSMALVLLVAFGGVALHQAAMRDMVVNHNLYAVRGAAASLSQQLAQRSAVLAELARTSRQAAGGVDGGSEALFSEGVAFYDAQGNLLADSSDNGLWQNPALRATLHADGVRFIALPDENGTPAWIATVVPGEGANGPVVGITSLRSLGLPDVLRGLHPNDSTDVMLVTPAGTVLYHTDPTQIGRTLSNSRYLDAARNASSGADISVDEQPRGVVTTFARVEASGWVLVQEEQWQRSMGLLTRYSQAAPLVLVPGLLIAGAAVWFGIRRIVNPLQQLENRATELAWGDFESIEQPVGGIAEIQQLQATLQHLASRVRSTQAGMRNYIGAITQTQEEERARLARELHDQTVQTLIALGHREQQLKQYVADHPEAVDVLADLRAMTLQAVEDLRRIIRAMRPVYLEELGLVPALEMLVHDLNLSERAIDVSFEKHGDPVRLAPDHEMALYRVAQEALNNVWQHSGASHAWLVVRFADGEIVISVRDDGQGFEAPRRVADLSEEGHFGIMGMYERAALINAHLHIESEQGEGTTIRVQVPLNDRKAEASRGAEQQDG
jgi:signal transduction histidine kinase